MGFYMFLPHLGGGSGENIPVNQSNDYMASSDFLSFLACF